jgi:hypothetical protein
MSYVVRPWFAHVSMSSEFKHPCWSLCYNPRDRASNNDEMAQIWVSDAPGWTHWKCGSKLIEIDTQIWVNHSITVMLLKWWSVGRTNPRMAQFGRLNKQSPGQIGYGSAILCDTRWEIAHRLSHLELPVSGRFFPYGYVSNLGNPIIGWLIQKMDYLWSPRSLILTHTHIW